jgi:hypothetical protein
MCGISIRILKLLIANGLLPQAVRAAQGRAYLPADSVPTWQECRRLSCYVGRFVKRARRSGAQDRRRGRRFDCRSIFTRVVTSVSVSTRCQSDIRGLVTSRADCFGWSGSQV